MQCGTNVDARVRQPLHESITRPKKKKEKKRKKKTSNKLESRGLMDPEKETAGKNN
jgi:hypothetical protein